MGSHYIDGAWVAGSGAVLESIDPARGEVVWRGYHANSEEIGQACRAARAAFAAWSSQDEAQRAEVLLRFRDGLKRDADVLARAIAQEVGKPLWEARTEVASMANKVDISFRAYRERTGVHRTESDDGATVLRHRPHGVFAVFGPYNFPGHLPNGHIVPALLAGNTIVFKPSEYAPGVAEQMARLWEEAGLPAGVLNLVNGGRDTGAALAAQQELDGLLFTGSYHTGALLHRLFAGQPGKLLALEMGGNNPLIVWGSHNERAALHHTLMSAFVSAGQRCTCARRLILPRDAAGDRFLDALIVAAGKLRVGPWDDEPQPFMGPVVTTLIAARLVGEQEQLTARGAKTLLPMRHLKPGSGFLTAGILDVTDVSELQDEELFGPLLQVVRVANFDAALDAANATSYGLAAALLSDDAALFERFVREVRAGVINWNRPTTGAASAAPFGGVGRSGNHRPSAYYAADYCAYPVASMETPNLELPTQLAPGMVL